jgi:hypothetical protein
MSEFGVVFDFWGFDDFGGFYSFFETDRNEVEGGRVAYIR